MTFIYFRSSFIPNSNKNNQEQRIKKNSYAKTNEEAAFNNEQFQRKSNYQFDKSNVLNQVNNQIQYQGRIPKDFHQNKLPENPKNETKPSLKPNHHHDINVNDFKNIKIKNYLNEKGK